MEEVLIIGNTAEAEAADKELQAFFEEFETKREELDSIKQFKAEMEAKGAGANPYSRFDVASLEVALSLCEAASLERSTRLGGEHERLASIDEQKKEFAKAADAFLAWIKAEKVREPL